MKVFTHTSIKGSMQSVNDRSKRLWFMCMLFAVCCLGNIALQAQTSVQNFGTGSGTQTSQTGTSAFLPNPTLGGTWSRAGATAPAAPIVWANTSNPLGTTGSFVRAVASSSGSVSKFSPITGYTGSTEFYTSFKVMFGDAAGGSTATSGSWSFYQGAGAMYGDASDFTGAQVFTGLRFTYGAGGAIAVTYRGGASFINTGLSPNSLSSSTVYTIEIVGNNKTSGAINYTYNGVAQSVAVQKFDLYINGSKAGDDLAEAALPAGTNLVSQTFIGISSTANVANIFVDDVVVYNAVPAAIGNAAPTVTTNAAPSAIGTTTATLNGNVTSDGGSTVTGRGVVYAETATNSTPAISGTGVTDLSTGGTTGAFSVSATSLAVNTQYSYRAYAINGIGTSYGGVSGTTFYTLANTPTAPTVDGATSGSLNVTIGGADGNPSVTEYAIQETGSSNYVQTDGTLGASAAFQTASAWGVKTVTGLTPSTSYTFQVKARNGAGTETVFGSTTTLSTLSASSPALSASTLTSFGNVCTNTTAGPNTFTLNGTNLTTDPVTVASLNGFTYSTDDVTYTTSLSISQPGGTFSQTVYVKFNPTLVQPYSGNIVVAGGGVAAFNVAATGSGINTAPSVTTGTATSITQVSADLDASIPDNGCTAVSSYGFEYSTSNGFGNGTGTPVASGNLSFGNFSASVSGLNANTTYYYHAIATNSGGTSYGAQQSFTTSALDAPDAQAATSITGTSFVANWDPVPGATSYRLDVSTSPTFATTNATDLFISEYVEGSSNNKYIEIFNGTGASVNLSDYKLQLFTNGSPTVSTDVALSGTLANGATIVYKNASAAAYGGTTVTNAAVNYNGDDAVALYKISTASFVDIFGSIGFDPGTAWTGAGGYSTLDKTLVRNANVGGGLTSNPATSFPTLTSQWTLFNIDDVSHLGGHTYSASNPILLPGYDNLTVNGTSQVVSGLNPNVTYYYRVRAFSTNSTSANSNVISAQTLCEAYVTASAGANGTITPTGVTTFNCADDAEYTITANTCYTIQDVVVDGISVGPVSSYTFNNISAGNHTISATFALNTFNITASAGAGGSISPDGISVVNCGGDITYDITPTACNSIADVLVDGVSVGAVSTYTFNNVNDIHTISASFAVIPYTITVNQGANGNISPGTGTIDCGGSQLYTITADPCYTIADVLVDGVSVGAVSSYEFTNVQAPHTITASFTLINYTIVATSGANGTVTPAGSSSVGCGSNSIYTITPSTCYHVADVLVDGVSVGAVTTYTFTDVQDDHTISATFAINLPLVAPVVTGPVNICQYIGTGDPVVYTFNSVNATGYSYILPPNVTLVSSTSNSITVNFLNGFAAQANKQIRVTALSSCGNSPQTIYYLVAQSPNTPAPITGNNNVCPIIGTPGTYTYTISPVAGASSYAWTAQAGTTSITHPNGPGINDTIITVSFTNSFTSSSITVQAVNGCGTSNARSILINKIAPTSPGIISGPTNVCAYIAPGGTSATYSVPAVAGNTYNWTIPGTALNVTGQGTASISFTYPSGYTGGTISVVATNGCGTSGVRTLTVTKLNPSTPSAIDVIEAQGCPDRIFTYTLSSMPANATSVQWTYPVEGTLISGQGTTSIAVSYPGTAVNGTVTATALSNCGSSQPRSASVKLAACEDGPPPPPPPFAKGMAPATTATEMMEVAVYPNPTVNDFRLQVKSVAAEKINVRIMDMQGRSLKQFTVMAYQITTIGSDLKPGSYMVEVRQGASVKTTKLIKF
ncbi:MAG: lamin tail domain-containing protein [Bacteroidetes bacterium]|nr:lamin tail domain-containing protein [Bacteroidota bacterium]